MKTFKVGNFMVAIEKNPDVLNPREIYQYPTVMICWHERYEIGDWRPEVSPDTYLRQLMQKKEWARCRKKVANNVTLEEVKQYINRHVFMLPIYILDFDGVVLSTKPFADPLEEKPIGFIYVSREDTFYEDNLKSLEEEVETYNCFLSGEFYDYSIKDANGKEIEYEQGFFGYENCKAKAIYVAQSLP